VNDVPQRDSNTGRDTKQQPLPYRKIEGGPRDILLRRYKCPIICLVSQWWESLSGYKREDQCKRKWKNNSEIFRVILHRQALNLHRVCFKS